MSSGGSSAAQASDQEGRWAQVSPPTGAGLSRSRVRALTLLHCLCYPEQLHIARKQQCFIIFVIIVDKIHSRLCGGSPASPALTWAPLWWVQVVRVEAVRVGGRMATEVTDVQTTQVRARSARPGQGGAQCSMPRGYGDSRKTAFLF